ncbi:MIF domain protein [Aspergillus fijiensis CBS 313.89]|uniref:L-dopachrome isomerase n=1 Tax=Aspergillus fijiensis CBS 313.89 TaxID=1448319 RepID=A0A8G1W2V5_9EURO|nr:Tautomerase/MIF [Aspergillus fijiensis CBS 313.89]RAK78454.1 Tautomerase/MIF [Aspergillus fijiensis CBS 313.89]
MTPRRRRFEFSFRKRHSGPSTSSSSISPTVPVLQSPMAFQALGARTISEATLKQKNKLDRAPVRPSMFLEEKDDDEHAMYPIKPGVPADVKPTHLERKSIEGESVLRPKSQYFEEMFNIRGLVTSPRTQITHEAVTVVEVKINTRVSIQLDDDTLASTISTRMAQILEKPEVFIMTTIQQGACVYFGNSNTPAYLMKVFALPFLIAPIMNLRSTILIQMELQKILNIAPNRGVILYIPMPEENLATNGVTVMGQLANLERGTGIFRTISRTVSRKLKSGSTQSAPISVATTSSWNFSDRKSPASMAEDQSHGSEASKEGKKLKLKSRSRSTTKARSSLSSAVRGEDAGQPEPVDNGNYQQ